MDASRQALQAEDVDAVELYQRTVRGWTALVQGVPPDRWDAATPCSEWSVRALVNHVVGEDAWTIPLLRGATIDEVGSTLDGDLLGDDPVGAARRNADAAVEVVTEKVPAGGSVHLSYGDEDMEEYIRQLAADHLVHGWDLAAGSDQDRTLEEDLVREVADWFADREEIYRGGGAVGPRVEAGGDPQTELLAGFGRDARWTPPQP
jgi:uncharacterized protein (TIGR03086 family)